LLEIASSRIGSNSKFFIAASSTARAPSRRDTSTRSRRTGPAIRRNVRSQTSRCASSHTSEDFSLSKFRRLWFSDDSERFHQRAATLPREGPCRRQSFSGWSRNRKRCMALAAQTDAREGGSILHKDSGLSCTSERCHVLHMIRVHDGGMPVSLLHLD